MRTRIYLLLSFFALLFSCSKNNEYNVNGTINLAEYNGKKVYLYENRLGDIILDSATIDNGVFTFKGIAPDTVKLAFLGYRENSLMQPLIIEKGEISLLIDSANYGLVKIGGTPLNDDYQSYKDEFDNIMQNSAVIGKEMEEAFNNPNLTKEEEEKWKQIEDSVLNGIEDHVCNFIMKYSNNALGEFVFLDDTYFIRPDKVEKLYSSFRPEFDGISPERKAFIAAQKNTAVGQKYTDVKGLDINDKEVAFSNFIGKGKVVLIDFWASWCGPCIASLPELKEFYDKNKNKGLVVLGVSLDDNKKAWINATEKHQIKWPQLSNLKGWDEPAAKQYGVRGIPQTILVDQEGNIVGRNMSFKKYQNLLDELTSKK